MPSALLRAGIPQFHNLDLGLFLAEIGKIKVRAINELEVARRNADGRAGARWDRVTQSIVVVCKRLNHPELKSRLPLLALHEYLGIFGFKDHEYKMSTLMWFLALPDAQKNLTAPEKKMILKRISAYAKVDGGGVVGVGGGGDLLTLYFRTEYLPMYAKELGTKRGKRERQELWADIEHELNSQDLHSVWPGGTPRPNGSRRR